MFSRLAIWLIVILFGFLFAGHLFDLSVNVPNWKSGEIVEVSAYRDFYVKTTPKVYFLPVMLGLFVVNLLGIVLIRRANKAVRLSILICMLIVLIVFVFTILVFVPINDYILANSDYAPDKLKKLVTKWVKLDYFRLLLVGIGFASSIFAIDAHYQE